MTSVKLFILLIFMTSSLAHAKLYRWVDDSGKVHFSDTIPPAMAQKGHTSLNKNGIESAKVSSAEELKLKQQEKERNADSTEMSEARQAEAEQQQKDKQLLATYETREEIISTFNNRISLIDQSIGILNARNESLTQKLNRLNKKYKQTKSETSRVTLSMSIEDAKSSSKKYRTAIASNRTDKELITEKYRQTLIRFDHLTKSSH